MALEDAAERGDGLASLAVVRERHGEARLEARAVEVGVGLLHALAHLEEAVVGCERTLVFACLDEDLPQPLGGGAALLGPEADELLERRSRESEVAARAIVLGEAVEHRDVLRRE